MATERYGGGGEGTRQALRPRRESALAQALGGKLYRVAGLLLAIAVILSYLEPILHAVLIGFLAVILAIAFNAAVERIPLGRGASTVIVALATLGAIAGFAWFAVRYLAEQVRALLDELPALTASIDEWEAWIEQQFGIGFELLGPTLREVVQRLTEGIDGMRVLTGVFGAIEIFALAVLVLIGAFFAVGRPNEGLLKPMLRTVPQDRRPAFRRMFLLLGERIAAWIWGTLLASFAVGTMSTVVFWLLGTPSPLLLGTLVGITNVIPLVGPWIGGAVAVVATLIVNPGLALWVLLAVLVIQEVESNLIRPFVMSGVAKVHPFPTLLALVLFTSMFGVLGAILSLPLLIVIGTAVEVLWVEETLGDRGEVQPVVQ